MRWWFGLILIFLLIPGTDLAATIITAETLNGAAADATLNINDSVAKVDISLTASEAVKWNTLAVCLVSDTTCSRSTAVKYFTSTSAFTNNIVKTWDGKTSAGESVAVGDYKLKATVKNEAGVESIIELTDYIIKVSAGELLIGQTNTSEQNNTIDNSSESNDDSSGSNSAHSSSASLAAAKKTAWQLDLGRERQVLVDQVVPFTAKDISGAPGDSNIIWNFGDGWSAVGRAVFHRYSRPGQYEVVVNGHANNGETVARTKITVLTAKLSLVWDNNEPGVVVVNNQQKGEINLGDFRLMVNNLPIFTFPKDTIIIGGGSLSLDQELTKLTGREEVMLISAANRVLITLPPVTDRLELLATVAKLSAELEQAKKTLANRAPTKNTNVLTLVSDKDLTPTTTTLKLTAGVSTSWWQRWLKLIRVP